MGYANAYLIRHEYTVAEVCLPLTRDLTPCNYQHTCKSSASVLLALKFIPRLIAKVLLRGLNTKFVAMYMTILDESENFSSRLVDLNYEPQNLSSGRDVRL